MITVCGPVANYLVEYRARLCDRREHSLNLKKTILVFYKKGRKESG
ncbi:MAG: hypothetical protein QW171_02160 [Candidatus Bilamarchaeaceae archaeon]